jgi:segregation and condensation protein A
VTPGGQVSGELEPTRFPVEAGDFRGPLEELVLKAQRGEVDLTGIPVGAITRDYRRRLHGPGPKPDLRDVADFLTLVSRLVALKAQAVLPEQREGAGEEEEGELDESERRLAEYRLFKAAAEALLAEAAEEGARSFLGLVSPDVIPVERMRIAPERLAAAFRAVLERIAEAEPLPLGVATFSVEEKVSELSRRLRDGPIDFDRIFTGVGSRLEAVACFLALLELLRRGEAVVEQVDAFGPIRVSAWAGAGR